MTIENPKRHGNSEEEYFFKLNQELIAQRRKEQDALNSEKAEQEKRGPHWMKCPKCSQDLVEVALAGINVDQCKSCNGIYFDHGELEILMDSKEPKGFLGAMKSLFAK